MHACRPLGPVLACLVFGVGHGACTPEIDLGEEGLAPTPVILSPSDGTAVPKGMLATQGRMSDPQDAPFHLFGVWSVRDAGGTWRDVCSGFGEEDGTTRCLAPVTPGDDGLRLRATDLAGYRRDEVLRIDVIDASPPAVSLEGPDVTAGPSYADHPVSVRALVSDDDDPFQALTVTWVSSLDGPLDGPTHIDGLGLLEGVLALSEGQHDVTLTVQDPFGLVASDTVKIVVGPDNEPPLCRVDTPEPGEVQATGVSWSIAGYGRDPEWGMTDVIVTLRSDVDGVLAEGALHGNSVFAFDDVALTRGEHTLRVTVEDHVGARCERTLPVRVDDPPTLSVQAPAIDLVLTSGERLPIDVTVDHPTKDLTTLRVTALSDLTGPWTLPAPDDQGRVVTTVPIQPGNHTVRLQAIDADDLVSHEVVREIAAGAAP